MERGILCFTSFAALPFLTVVLAEVSIEQIKAKFSLLMTLKWKTASPSVDGDNL